jgi:hypothetical protein
MQNGIAIAPDPFWQFWGQKSTPANDGVRSNTLGASPAILSKPSANPKSVAGTQHLTPDTWNLLLKALSEC